MSVIDIVMRIVGGQQAAKDVVQVAEGVEAIKTEAQGATQALASVGAEAKKLGSTVNTPRGPLKALGNDAKDAAASVKLSRGEMVNLGYQIQDIGVMLAMGANPFTILITQGTQLASVLGASKVAAERGFLGAVGAAAMQAAKPVGVLAAAVGALATAWTGFQAMLAEGDAEKAIANLGEANRRFGDTILKQLDEFVAKGRISVDRAKEISADIRNAFGDEGLAFGAKMPVGAGGLNASNPGLVSDLLNTVGRELRSKLPPQFTQAAAEAHRAAGMGRLEAEREIQRAMAQLDLQRLENSHKAGEIGFEGFQARRREIATKEYQNELKWVAAQEQELRMQILAADDDTKKKLSVKAAEFMQRRKQAAIELEAELNQISADGVKERQAKIDEAVQRAAKKLAAVNQAAAEEREKVQRAFQMETSGIQANFKLTDPARYDALRRAAEAAADAGTITRDELALFKAQLGPDPASWVDQWTNGINRLADSWGTLQQQVTGSVFGLIQTGVDGLASGIARAVVVTGDLKQAWADVKIMVLQALAQEVIGYGIRKGLALGWKALTSSLRAADTAETVTAESTKAAAAAPAATMMSISSWGLAAIIGGAAILGALASVAFREQGGPVEAGKPYIVGERRPELFIPRTSGVILPRVPSPDLPNLSAGGAGAMGGGVAAQSSLNVGVQMHGDIRSAVEAAMFSGAGEQYLVDVVRKEIRKFSPGT